MRPATFEYVRATTLGGALASLDAGNASIYVLAGGQSLLRQMRHREIAPRRVVDISALAELDSIAVEGDDLMIGALTPLARLVADAEVAARCPALCEAALRVADVQIRNRATVGGNVCTGASGDVATVLAASGGEVVLRSTAGERRLPASELLARGERPCAPGEFIIALRFPGAAASAFDKLARRAVDPAIANAAAFLHREGTALRVALALGAVHTTVVRMPALHLRPGDDLAAIEAAVAERARDLEPPSTPHASADYRRRVIPVIARRAVAGALRRLARGGA